MTREFRLSRQADYRRAREAIQSGRDPAEAGIPGWDMRPLTSRLSPGHRIGLVISPGPAGVPAAGGFLRKGFGLSSIFLIDWR